jgi:hypothetical protein
MNQKVPIAFTHTKKVDIESFISSRIRIRIRNTAGTYRICTVRICGIKKVPLFQ